MIGAALAAAAAGGAVATGGGLLRDYLSSRYEDNRAEKQFGYDTALAEQKYGYDSSLAAQKYGYDSSLNQQQFGFNSSLSAQGAEQDRNLARLNSALRVQEDSSKYQRAVADMEKAGLNVGALGAGGFQSPTIQSAQANSTIANFDPKNSVERALFATAKRNSRAFNSALALDQKRSRNAVVSALKATT